MSTQERIEYARYDKAQLEQLVKAAAQLALIGSLYYGKVTKQDVRWCDDGTIEVFTHHVPGTEARTHNLVPTEKANG